MSARRPLPRWADIVLLPVLNLVLALAVSGLVVLMVGQNPLQAIWTIITGAFGSFYNIGYTLYFTTNFIFAGLAVALAAHAGLFNIGGNGQAYVAGIGATVAALWLDQTYWFITMPVAMIAAAVCGGIWGFIPGYLQARRGSHVVITTIMFNFIAAALMVYLVNHVFKPADKMGPESRVFLEGARIPQFGEFIRAFHNTPVNLMLIVALLALAASYVFIWHSKLGFAIRTLGHNPTASLYAGRSNARLIMVTMTLSGMVAGMVAVNEVLGVQGRLTLDFVADVGFVGIAVALMGRNHPVGVLFAALLFGVLYQGGGELQFVMPGLTREVVVVIQALVILFTGAMEGLLRAPLEGLFTTLLPGRTDSAALAVADAER